MKKYLVASLKKIWEWILVYLLFKNLILYSLQQIRATSSSIESVCGGLAIGAAICVTPFFGLHIITTIGLCRIFGYNTAAGVLGTFVSNPLNIPFIIYISYDIGVYILEALTSMTFDYNANLISELKLFVKSFFDSDVMNNNIFNLVFLPIFIGSLPIGIVCGVVTYYVSKKLIIYYDTKGRADW